MSLLRDLRTAVQNYLDTQVAITISAFTPATGTSIQPGEQFTFSVTGTNASGVDAIRLINVRYVVRVIDPAVAKLVVPATNPDAMGIRYKGPGLIFGTLVDLAPNARVSEMYIYPPASMNSPFYIDRAGDLNIGDSDTLTLTGEAGSAVNGGNTQIMCQILADPDLDFIFPKNENTPSTSKSLVIIG
ncbi:MAG TPA: hypothetical protein V6C65_01885 [Allocoleopsis sp.]